MAPVETQKTPAVGMSDADDAEEDGKAALLQQRMQPSDAAGGQQWCEGGSVCVCECAGERERERENGKEGGRRSPSPSATLPPHKVSLTFSPFYE